MRSPHAQALIASLDSDGDGTVSLHEFVELSRVTGLSKSTMRQRFREHDHGESGLLTSEQMFEVLRCLREEVMRRRERANRDGGGVGATSVPLLDADAAAILAAGSAAGGTR